MLTPGCFLLNASAQAWPEVDHGVRALDLDRFRLGVSRGRQPGAQDQRGQSEIRKPPFAAS